MSSYFNNAVDFGFRPIRPETGAGGGAAAGVGYYDAMDCGVPMEACPPPPSGFGWSPERDGGVGGGCSEDEELFTSDNEMLPDVTGFGARQRELNALQAHKAAARKEELQPGPFHGSTLLELCAQYGEMAGTSATPCDVWADVLDTLREREKKKRGGCLDPSTARHMKYRTTLIEWILEVCADFNFGPTTADLAVQYMVRGFIFFTLLVSNSRTCNCSGIQRPSASSRARRACH